MNETDDIDKYRRVLDYFTNDDGSGEFSTGSGKFDLESPSFVICLQSRGTSSKDYMSYFLQVFKSGYFLSDFPSRKLPKMFLMSSQSFCEFLLFVVSRKKKFSLFKSTKSGKFHSEESST